MSTWNGEVCNEECVRIPELGRERLLPRSRPRPPSSSASHGDPLEVFVDDQADSGAIELRRFRARIERRRFRHFDAVVEITGLQIDFDVGVDVLGAGGGYPLFPLFGVE